MSDNQGFDVNKAVDQVKGDKNLMMVVGGALAVIVGLFLPWYSVSSDFLGVSFSASPGFGDSTGILLLVFSVAAVATSLNVFNQDKKNMAIVAIVAAVLCALIMLSNWPDSDLGGAVSVGIGFWLGVAGSIAMIAGSAMGMQSAGKGSASKSAGMPKKKDDK